MPFQNDERCKVIGCGGERIPSDKRGWCGLEARDFAQTAKRRRLRLGRWLDRRIRWGGGFGGTGTNGLGGKAEFSEILLGQGGLRVANGFEVLRFDFLVNFTAVDGNTFGRLDADPNHIAIDPLDDQNDIIADLDRLVDFAGKGEHGGESGGFIDQHMGCRKVLVVEQHNLLADAGPAIDQNGRREV